MFVCSDFYGVALAKVIQYFLVREQHEFCKFIEVDQ